jgi:hypothetical protein
VAQRKIVFAYTGSQNSLFYQSLVHDIHEGKLDKTSFDTMKRFGVTHLYIGSQASWWPAVEYKWYPEVFKDNPNFKLVKSYGDAYLFEVLYLDPDLVFAEDFNRPNLEEEGWMFYVPQDLEGNGQGDISIELGAAPQGTNSAKLVARKDTGEFYWTSIAKAVYLGGGTDDEYNVQISFGLRAAEGFGPHDDLMLVVSDGDWQRQVYFVVPPGVGAHWKPELQVPLPEAAAWNQLDLSQLWQDIHGSSLPASFYVQIINSDTDGVANVAHLDYIQISRGG